MSDGYPVCKRAVSNLWDMPSAVAVIRLLMEAGYNNISKLKDGHVEEAHSLEGLSKDIEDRQRLNRTGEQ